MTITRNFKLCLNAGTQNAPYINVNQYDEGEQWIFDLYTEGGQKFAPSTGAIIGIKSDGNAILNSGTVNSDGQVVITETQQMTAASGLAVFELLIEGETHGTANFIVNVERRPSDDAEFSDSDLSMLQEAINSAAEIEDLLDGETVDEKLLPIVQAETSDWLADHITNPSNPPIDTSLTVAGAAADAKATGDEITDLKSAFSDLMDYAVNIVNPDDLVIAQMVNQTNGEFANTTYHSRTGYIPVEGGATYSLANWNDSAIDFRYAFYTENLVYISGEATNFATVNYLLTAPANAAFIAVSAETNKQPVMIAKSDSRVNYVSYEPDTVKLEVMPKIDPEHTTFFEKSVNMLDPTTMVAGEYVNQTTGAFASNQFQTRTDYIRVYPGYKYCITNFNNRNISVRFVFYKQDKTYISGAMPTFDENGYIITAPNNAWYLIVSVEAILAPIMIAQSESIIEFVPYYVSLKDEYSVEKEPFLYNLPYQFYGAVGYETNIYFSSIVENWEDYDWNIIADKGQQLERGYRIIPTEAGTTRIEIEVRKNGTFIKKLITRIIVASATSGNGATTNVIVLGDSTTDNGTAVSKIHENLSAQTFTVNTLGTRGTAPNNHEGRSGWTFNYYFTKESMTYTDGRGTVYNPFYNPSTQTFDASYYFANSGVAVPDWFFINLGINDMFDYTDDTALKAQIATCKGYLDSMIASIKAVSSNINIGVCLTIPPNDSQDAFGKAYNCGQTRNRYKHNNFLWVNAMIAEYDERTAEKIWCIPLYASLDTKYNMGIESIPVNARNTLETYQSPIANGTVHPVESGYWQIADVYTAFLKYRA